MPATKEDGNVSLNPKTIYAWIGIFVFLVSTIAIATSLSQKVDADTQTIATQERKITELNDRFNTIDKKLDIAISVQTQTNDKIDELKQDVKELQKR
jgi:peptidoglycan hydrolase CwlO-like protein